MSFDGSQHRVPVFKRDFLSSLSKEIGSKWPSTDPVSPLKLFIIEAVPIDDYLSLQKSETNSNQKFKMYHVEDDNNFVLYQCAHKRHSPHGNWNHFKRNKETAGAEIFVSMLNPDFERFDSFVCSWNSCQKLWFILVDDGKYLDSRLGLEEKKPDSSSGPSLASIESKSRLMGLASRNAHHNITNVISAPNFKCITAAAGFIRGYEDAVKMAEKLLTIKIDGGFAETYFAFKFQSQFRLLAIENGYRVDETYESSAIFPVEYHHHPHLQLEKRLATTMESMKEKFAERLGKHSR
ncbi:Lysozyme [Trichinella spiralis]|uniref:Lysozyme n=1 Tax=Trichinella spiralis TaxID=6334 RepID=A0ABR3KA11_TRISP